MEKTMENEMEKWSYVGVYRDYELCSELLKGGYVGDYIGNCYRGY